MQRSPAPGTGSLANEPCGPLKGMTTVGLLDQADHEGTDAHARPTRQ